MDEGFAPHVHRHAAGDGDPRAKELWELWGKLAEAEKAHREAKERLTKAESARNQASCDVGNTGRELQKLYEQLTKKLALPTKPSEGSPVT